MNPNIRTETYKGKKIFIHDYKGLVGKDLAEKIPGVVKDALLLGPDQLVIIDVTTAIANGEVVEAFKKAAVDMKPVTKKMAVVGITPFQKVLLSAVKMFSDLEITPFNTLAEAMEWIVME
jgi:hypothetical protein